MTPPDWAEEHWVETDEVGTLLQTDLTDDPWIEGTILHAQELVEAEIGAQPDVPDHEHPPGVPDFLPAGLKAVVTQISARLWRAGKAAAANPEGRTQDTLGPHSFTAGPFAAGFGLTKGEKKQLARFRSPLWVQPITVGGVTEPPPGLLDDAGGGDQILYFHEDDMPAPS